MSVDLKKNCRAITSPKKQTDEFVFLSWRLRNTWNLKSKFKFQVFPSHQDRKTNSFVCFWEKLRLNNFWFKIYWPLEDIFREFANVPKWNGIFRNDFTLFWQGLIFAKGGAYQVPSVIALYYVISDSICHRAKIH